MTPRQSGELRDPDDARLWLGHGLWLSRLSTPRAGHFALIALTLSEGTPLPPAGWLVDLEAVLAADASQFQPLTPLPGMPLPLVKQYEHQVLGRLISDPLLDRAALAIRRYSPEERPRGVSFVARRMIERLNLPGIMIAPNLVRQAGENAEFLRDAYNRFETGGPHPRLVPLLEELISGVRRAADLIGPEDLLALEQRTALGDLAQYVAHRQVLQQARQITAMPQPPRPAPRQVPTRYLDDDHYPVGGYASIGTKGSIESLLHSQLAYMEKEERPDLFDVKFVRDELFYYTRDENQFRRTRRGFGFHFDASLEVARVKDPGAPVQRMVQALALVLATIRVLSQHLSEDALQFHLTFAETLDPERELMAILLTDERRRGVAHVSVNENPEALWKELAAKMFFRGDRFQTHNPGDGIVVIDAESDYPALFQKLIRL